MKYPLLFSSSERRGLYLLLLLMAAFALSKFLFFSNDKVLLAHTPKDNKSDTVLRREQANNYHYKKDKESHYQKKEASALQQKVIYERPKIEPVELNTASAEQLITLNGIGEGYASRILKYREIIGGYIAKEQLLHVYGLDSTLYQKIKNDVWVNPSLVKKYNINEDSEEELAKCRRIGYKRAKVLVNYRNQHGKFSSVKDLLKTRVFNDSLLYLIEPYILIQ